MIDEARLRRIERSAEQLLTRDYVIGEGARVYNSANISITDSSATNLTFDSERFDYGGYHSTSSNTDRLTVPADGIYIAYGNVLWASNATGYRQIVIQLNGTTNIALDRSVALNGTATAQDICSQPYQLSASDYLTLRVFQNSGGNLNVSNANNYSPEFSIWRIG